MLFSCVDVSHPVMSVVCRKAKENKPTNKPKKAHKNFLACYMSASGQIQKKREELTRKLEYGIEKE